MGLVARRTIVLLGGAAISIAAGVFQAVAQDVAIDDAVTTEEEKQGRVTILQRIVVGAGQDKVAIDTPQAVSVVEQEEIDQVQAQTVGEVLRTIPGVNTSGSERAFGQAINIRGIGVAETAAEEGRIIVNVDGAQKYYEQYRMGSLFTDMELYKRVEVLRGPASSTLYGSGAIGGVVNLTTKDATDFIEDGNSGALKLKGGYNSNGNGWLGSFVFAQKITEDFDFLLAGNYRKSDAYRTGNGTVIGSSDFAAWSGLAKATWQVGDEGTLRLSYQRWDSDAAGQGYEQIGGPNQFGLVDRHVVDETVVVSYENPFSDNDMLDLKVLGSFSNTTVDQKNATGMSFGMFPFNCSNYVMFCDTDYGYRTWQFKVENTSHWYGDTWDNHLTYGVQFAHQTRTAAVDPAGGGTYIGFHPEGTDLKTGFYVQNEFVWDERLTLIPGVRVDWRRLTPTGSTPLSAAKDDWAFSPKLAAHYKITDSLAVFGSVAHAERFPSIDETFQTGSSSALHDWSPDLKKERANNFELGFAVSGYDVLQSGDGIQFKATGFYNQIKDLIAFNSAAIPSGAPFPPLPYIPAPGYVNIDSARIYGVELEAAYDSDYVFANASYTYTIGKNTRTGAYLPTVAPHEFGFTLGAKLPEQGLTAGWRSRIVADPQDPADRTAATTGRFARAFDVHDVFVTWKPQDDRFRGWEVAGGVDNIFNAQYKEYLHNEPSKGRTFKLSLSKQFGW